MSQFADGRMRRGTVAVVSDRGNLRSDLFSQLTMRFPFLSCRD